MFTVSVFLVFCNRAVAIIFALVMAVSRGEPLTNVAPLWKYFAISLSNVGATTCQYEALKYVAFPVQMLGKSFKMMPVMLWGIAISGKRYGYVDWLVAGAVTCGVTEFLLTGNIAAKQSDGTSMHGLMLLGLFLALDGFTSTFQEKLFSEYSVSKYNQMLYVNIGSACVSMTTMLLTGSVGKAFDFCAAHPELIRDASVLSSSAVGAQFFIYSQVKEFGALVFAATMNVRQLISIMISYQKYGNSISTSQVWGLVLVFSALFYKSFSGFRSSGKGEEEPLLPESAKASLAKSPPAGQEGSPGP